MTEVTDQRSAVRNQNIEINRRAAQLFPCALGGSGVKLISDLRVLISGLCALLDRRSSNWRKHLKLGDLNGHLVPFPNYGMI